VTFVQAQLFDPNEFRLVPQTRAQRERREAALQQRRAQEDFFAETAVRVSVMKWAPGGGLRVQADTLPPWFGAPPAAITSMTPAGKRLVVGDSLGGLRVWDQNGNSWTQGACYQLFGIENGVVAKDMRVASVSLEALDSTHHPGVVAVGTAAFSKDGSTEIFPGVLDGPVALSVPLSVVKGGVVLVDLVKQQVKHIISDHMDSVLCMCSIPDGSLVTGGGKHDAKVKVWNRRQLEGQDSTKEAGENEAAMLEKATQISLETRSGAENANSPIQVILKASQVLPEPGYIVSAAVLPDQKPGSGHFALAGARYNVVKICL